MYLHVQSPLQHHYSESSKESQDLTDCCYHLGHIQFKQFRLFYLFYLFISTEEEKMKNSKIFFLLFLCLGYLKSLEGSPTVVFLSQKLKAGNIRVKCNFTLVFTKTDVDLEKSSVLCNKETKGKKAKVDTKTDEGYMFKGLIQPPNKIVKMSGGDYFEDFMDQMAEDSEDEGEAACGGFIDDNKRQRGFVHIDQYLFGQTQRLPTVLYLMGLIKL